MSRADDHLGTDEWLRSCSEQYYKIMIVEFNSGGASFIPVKQAETRQASPATTSDDSTASFSSQSLQASLKQAAEPRADKVAQASALANDSNYPSDTQLSQLAGFLSSRI